MIDGPPLSLWSPLSLVGNSSRAPGVQGIALPPPPNRLVARCGDGLNRVVHRRPSLSALRSRVSILGRTVDSCGRDASAGPLEPYRRAVHV